MCDWISEFGENRWNGSDAFTLLKSFLKWLGTDKSTTSIWNFVPPPKSGSGYFWERGVQNLVLGYFCESTSGVSGCHFPVKEVLTFLSTDKWRLCVLLRLSFKKILPPDCRSGKWLLGYSVNFVLVDYSAKVFLNTILCWWELILEKIIQILRKNLCVRSLRTLS